MAGAELSSRFKFLRNLQVRRVDALNTAQAYE